MRSIKNQIIITAILLSILIYFFGSSNADYLIQDKLYNFSEHKWLLEYNAQPYRVIFYTGAKKALIIFASTILIGSIIFFKSPLVQKYKRGIAVVIISAILVPVTIGGLKKVTNMPCPKDEIRYGGTYPKTAVWKHYKDTNLSKKHIKCWPAGHASGGFALLSLIFLFKSKRAKKLALLSAILVGWSMGGYKMLIGDHFLSHTIITMLMAWLLILIVARVFKFKSIW